MSHHAFSDIPSAWVARFAREVPEGEVLDLACGGGRHSRLFADLGHPVLAVDRDTAALKVAAGPGISVLELDLEADDFQWSFGTARFSAVVVTNYLHRPLFPFLLRCLAPGGILLYETFACGNEQFGKPSNPAFLLGQGELLGWLSAENSMRVIAYEDGYVHIPRAAMVQRVCAVKVAPGSTHLYRLA